MLFFSNPSLKSRINAGALFVVMILWGLHLAYPLNLLQNARWTLLGYPVPIYFFFTVGLIVGSAALVLAFKRRWSRWEILWWTLPLICLPGILHSSDAPWSTRQWLSWIVRGVIPGGVIFLTTARKKSVPMLLYWIYPVVIAASLLGLIEVYTSQNQIWDSLNYMPRGGVAEIAQPTNPFYRPHDDGSRLTPRGTQGNRIPYASMLVGFLPLGIWLLKYKKRFLAAPLFAVAILASILLLAQVRSAWAGALAALVLMQALGLLRNRRETIKVAAGALLCLGVFLVWPRTHDMLWARIHSFHLTQRTIRERLDILRTTTVLKDNWLVGLGFGQFPTAAKAYYPAAMIWRGTPDDQYLRWAIENGIPSLLLLSAFLIGLVRAGLKNIQRMEDVEEADYYRSLLAGSLGLGVTFFFFDGFYWGACNMTFWSLLGLFATSLKSTEPAAQ